MAAVVNTVADLLASVGIDNVGQFNCQTNAERLASDMFNDDFGSFIDKTSVEIEADLKTYSALTIPNGQIRLQPGQKRSIKVAVQWVSDLIRTDQDHITTPIPAVMDSAMLTRRNKTHANFVKKSSTLATTAKPSDFLPSMKWKEWVTTFTNFLHTIPGRDGVPLDYICRQNVAPDRTPQTDILKEYVLQAPLVGDSFTVDAAEVHTYLANLITKHPTAESKTQSYLAQRNGRVDFMALKDHFLGVGINSRDILQAETTLETLFYSGEKKPHMWWGKFENELTTAFTTFDLKEKRIVHSNEMKLRILDKKVNADFLQSNKAAIKVELTRTPMTMTYELALAVFRDEVNSKFNVNPTASTNRARRQIQETGADQRHNGGDSYRGRGRGRFGGRGGRHHGRGGRFGERGRGGRGREISTMKRKRNDSTFVTLTDGEVVEFHPTIRYPRDIFMKFKYEDRQRLMQHRNEQQHARYVQSMGMYAPQYPLPNNHFMNQGYNQTPQLQIGQVSLPPAPPVGIPPPPPPSNSDTPNGSIMGGRNSQQGNGRHFQGGRPS